jgi:hypothetical protein
MASSRTIDNGFASSWSWIKTNGALVIGVLAIFGLILIFNAMRHNAPALEVDLPTLERTFDANPATAMATYGNGPLLVRAVVSDIKLDELKLETVFLLSVTAHLSGDANGIVPGPIMLRCATVRPYEIGGGFKPELSECVNKGQTSR